LAGLSNPQFEISTGSNRLLVDHGWPWTEFCCLDTEEYVWDCMSI
jgi:hypothetical protein